MGLEGERKARSVCGFVKEKFGSDTCMEEWQMKVKGASERQREAGAAAGMAEGSRRTP